MKYKRRHKKDFNRILASDTNMRIMPMISILSIFICLVMITASSFAWFSVSQSNKDNQIVSGILKVDASLLVNGAPAQQISMSTDPMRSSWNQYGEAEISTGGTTIIIENKGTLDCYISIDFKSSGTDDMAYDTIEGNLAARDSCVLVITSELTVDVSILAQSASAVGGSLTNLEDSYTVNIISNIS